MGKEWASEADRPGEVRVLVLRSSALQFLPSEGGATISLIQNEYAGILALSAHLWELRQGCGRKSVWMRCAQAHR